jgi:hypothetical protein
MQRVHPQNDRPATGTKQNPASPTAPPYLTLLASASAFASGIELVLRRLYSVPAMHPAYCSRKRLENVRRSGSLRGIGRVLAMLLIGGFAGLPARSLAQTATALAAVNDTAGVILGGDGRVYGTNFDAASGNGMVYSMNRDGTGFTNLYTLAGASLYGLVQDSGGRLYGVGNLGTESEVFSLTKDGATFAVLHAFNGGAGGTVPSSCPLTLGSDGRLYGTTTGSTIPGEATVFAVNTDGSGFTTLYTFPPYQYLDESESVLTYGVIQGADGRLYGAVFGGPDGNSGFVFAIGADGTGYTQLFDFAGSGAPWNQLIQGMDGRLYGVVNDTAWNGIDAVGEEVYSLNPDGSGYALLCALGLPGSDECVNALLQGVDGRLYGVGSAFEGAQVDSGSSSDPEGQGMIFSVATDGTDLEAVCSLPAGFQDSGLVQDSSGRLYGSSSAEAYAFLAPLTRSTNPPVAVATGAALNLTGAAPIAGYTYQWLYSGSAIQGATGTQLSLPGIGATQAGYYTLLATSPGGTQAAATTQVSVTSGAWLTNLSARAYLAPTLNIDDLLIAGFVATGPSGKQLLLRGVGPSLDSVGILQGNLADPQLTLYSGPSIMSGPWVSWDPSLSALFNQLGAFPLIGGSSDAAAEVNVSPGAYTAVLSSKSGSDGIGIIEIYDADHGAPVNRLINLSARGYVGTGQDVLIEGFEVTGSSSETVLIRGIGPGLLGFLSGTQGVISTPAVTVFDSTGKIVATIEGWGTLPSSGNSGVAAGLQAATLPIMNSVGAWWISVDDAAMVVTLPPGAYTVEVADAYGGTGLALIEVYEVR